MANQMRLAVLALALLLVAPYTVACSGGDGGDESTLHYALPTRLIVKAGEYLPGTTIQYVGETEKGAHVLIDGQTAYKKTGDSLDWRGEPVQGVTVALALRILSFSPTELQLVGTATIDVAGAEPQAGEAVKTGPIEYSGVVAYHVPKGQRVPGSTLTYVGHTENGAELSGLEGYPYRKGGDSVSYEGSLREGVFISLELRVVQYDEDSLNVAGTVTLWLGS